ncbi:ATP-dependent translocase ABCB1-like [Cylas formicarius]|uniref:ATP-dependent translocase ABCB1-like n=1 Tax=Cylas formicarius TaxID=197179 RepID=UPI002958AD05|nr:ATP-dependent translocase ABCB1-like [Cylas formicarius]
MLKFSTKGDRFLMLLGTVAALASGAVDPLNRLFFGELTQNVIDYARNCSVNAQVCSDSTDVFMDAIAEFAYKNAIVGVASLILLYVASETFSYAAIRQVFKVRSLYLKSLLNKDISWYDVNTSGDFASRMGDDLSKFEDGIGEKIPLFLALQGSFISSLVLAIVKGWELALICVVSLPISITSTTIISFFITKLSKKELDAYGAAAAVAEEVLSSIRTVVAFGGQNKEKERYDSKLITARKCSDKKTFLQASSYGIYWFFILSSYGLAFWYGIKLMLNQQDWKDPVYTPGNMVTVFFSVMTGSQNFAIAAPFIELFAVAKSAGGKIFHIIESKPVVNLSKGYGEKPDGVRGYIKFSDVSFSYPSRNDVPIFQGFNLDITAGETVALVGSSGCGKSTVLQLIQRFCDPNGGKVFVDGVDIRDLDLSWYRSFIGVVGQEPILFETTIEENIKYGYPNATFEDVVAAAKKSNADNFINMLPNAYKTIVGERGAQLSGGQKQRIAIARALVKNPSLLLLDEATSALDTNSEAKVQSALDSARKQCTTIIVAHRLSTIKGANKIVVLSKGSVVEQGTHEELMALKGEYHALVTTQAKSEELLEKNYQRESTEVEDEDSNIKLVKEELTDVDQDVDIFVKKASIWSIVKMNAPEWFYLIVGSIGAALMGCSMPIFAVIFGSILQVLENTDADYVRSETNKYCLYFVGAGGLAAISTFLQVYMFGVAGEKLTLRLRSQMFEAMLRQEMGYFDRKTNGVGALCAQLSGEAAHVQGATGVRVSSIMNSMTGLVLAVVLSVYYQWKLGLVALGFFPVMIGGIFLQRQMAFGENEEYRISLQKSTKVAVEAVGNIRTVASLGCEEVFYQIYVAELLPHIKRSIKGTHGRALILGLSQGLSFFAYATCMYYGGYLIKDNEVEYGDVYKVCQALIMGTNSIANSLAFTPNMDKGLRASKNIMNLLNRVPKIRDNPEAVDKTLANGNV